MVLLSKRLGDLPRGRTYLIAIGTLLCLVGIACSGDQGEATKSSDDEIRAAVQATVEVERLALSISATVEAELLAAANVATQTPAASSPTPTPSPTNVYPYTQPHAYVRARTGKLYHDPSHRDGV